MSTIAFRSLALAVVIFPVAVFAGAAHARTAANVYTVDPLVSDSSATPAATTDASLVNGWGLSAGPTTPWWASDNGTNVSTLYSAAGAKVPLTVSVPDGHGSRWLYKGKLRGADGTPIAIDGLWAIAFGNGSAAGPADTLYFLAGPTGEQHGLLGSITAG